METINRPLLTQPVSTILVAVGTTATPIIPNQNKTDMVDSFVLSLDAAAANNVFVGDSSVTVNNGIEIIAGGGPVNFVIRNQWQQYDTQDALIAIAETLQCQQKQPKAIPFIVWDLSQIFLVAVAPTNVRVLQFRSQFA
jgi:hypothetical protein